MYYTIFAKREENFLAKIDVAPLAGARIEILRQRQPYIVAFVAPLAGARIEIIPLSQVIVLNFVAPLAGARIEILAAENDIRIVIGRSPRGSAD